MSKPLGEVPESMADPESVKELERMRIEGQIAELERRIENLTTLPDTADLESVNIQIDAANNKKADLQAELESLKNKKVKSAGA